MDRQDASLHDVLVCENGVHVHWWLFLPFHLCQTLFDLTCSLFLVFDTKLQFFDFLVELSVFKVESIDELSDIDFLIVSFIHSFEQIRDDSLKAFFQILLLFTITLMAPYGAWTNHFDHSRPHNSIVSGQLLQVARTAGSFTLDNW